MTKRDRERARRHVGELAFTPFGSYVPREVAERVVAMMTEGKA